MNNLDEYPAKRQKTITWICYGILALILVFSLYVDKSHAHSWVERYIPFFWGFFGFIAAAAIISFARWYAHSGIMVSEDYYERSKECCCCSNKSSSTEHA
jgi:hypothetical protein